MPLNSLIVAFLLGAVAAGMVVYIIMTINRTAERQREQADLLRQQLDRIAALEKVIETQRRKRGQLYEHSLEDLQARHARVGRLLKLGLRDLVDAINQSSPGTLKEILTELEITR